MVRFYEHSIEMSSVVRQNDIAEILSLHGAKFDDLTIYPKSVCALTWADNHRLFMCKVQAVIGQRPLGNFFLKVSLWKPCLKRIYKGCSTLKLVRLSENFIFR